MKILHLRGCTAFTGEDLFAELAQQRHVDPQCYVDYWHFKENVATVSIFDRWLERIMTFTSCSVFPVAWLHMYRHSISQRASLPISVRSSSLDTYDAFEFWGGEELIPAVV